MHPSPTRAQVYQMDDPCYDLGGDVPPIGIKIKDPMCGISRSPTNGITSGIYKWWHSNNQVMSIKNAKFKPQPSTPNTNLCINEKHTFYGNWWQRGRDCTKIWKLWERLEMDMYKEGATLKNVKGSKFLDKRSTQVGGASSWTLIDCIWHVHIHVLACIA